MRRAALVLLAVTAVAGPATAGAAVPPPAQPPPTGLNVALNMPSPGFQVGAVQGSTVVVARGLEVDLARAIAARLGGPPARFVQVPIFARLLAPGPKTWDMALAEITITPARARSVDFSVPYLNADQGVLMAKSVSPVPRSIAALAGLRLCSLRGTTGAALIARRIKPAAPARLVSTATILIQDVQTGACQAAVYDAPILATLKSRVPLRYGPFAGVIRTGEQYGIAFPQGSALRPRVNDALRALIGDGTVARLQRKWLTTDLQALPVLS